MYQTKEELVIHLKEQIYFLKSSSEAYDRGHEMEAKRLASIIRTLIHDTKISHSILRQLNVKDKIKYFNTAIPNTPFGLCGRLTTTEGGGKSMYSPPLNNLSDLRKKNPWIAFNSWWKDALVLYDGKNKFSRKDLVIYLANKDGGSHVDKELPEDYADLSRRNSLNFYHIDNTGEALPVNGAELASVRQIAFELLNTLETNLPEYF